MIISSAICSVAFADEGDRAETGRELKFTAGLVITEQYNDNIFATRTNKTPDGITVISPAANLLLRDSVSNINFGATGVFSIYQEFSSEDTQDYDLYTNGRFRLSPATLFVAGGGYARRHEDRSSPDEVFGEGPTVYYDTSAYAAIQQKSGPNTVKLGGTYNYLNFRDASGLFGPINNDDRDRDVATTGVLVSRELNPTHVAFAELGYDLRNYRLPFDDFGFDRDSRGVRANVGLRSRLSNSLETEAYGGVIYQNYDDAQFNTVVSPDFGGRLTWTPVPGLNVQANVDRTVQETTIRDASGYLQTRASLSFVQWLRPDVRLNGGLGYYDNDYQDIARHDEVKEAWLAIRRYVTPHYYFGANYVFTSRESTELREEYDQSIIMARLGRAMDPAYEKGDLWEPSVPQLLRSGPYVGVKTGHISPETKLAGERGQPGGDGFLRADFNDHGFAAGGFLGYGLAIGKWHVALEADATGSNARWEHSRTGTDNDGRIFSVERKAGYGLSAIFGRYLGGGSLLYGRAGALFQSFETGYRTSSGELFQRDDDLFGLRMGIGGSVALSDRLSLGLEYDYATFGDYKIAPPDSPDSFSNDESGAWLSLAYSFHPNSNAALPPVDHNWSGFYWGGQVGHGALNAVTSGVRNNDTRLVADFGESAVTGGMFAGYGLSFHRLFVAGELEADLSAAAWDHERGPTGRTFSMEKIGGVGAGLRFGYLVHSAALVYGRVGVMRSHFDIDLERVERDETNFATLEEWKNGLRYGLGLELPATRNLAFRLDYTFTDYGTLRLTEPSGNDVETYDTSESLFRIGSVIRL